jgi:hypothetical protein
MELLDKTFSVLVMANGLQSKQNLVAVLKLWAINIAGSN